jgi:hypothetical protein
MADTSEVILNVDDDPASRYTVTRILRQGGFLVPDRHGGGRGVRPPRRGRPPRPHPGGGQGLLGRFTADGPGRGS